MSVLEDPSHLFQCDIECVGWGVFLRRGRVSVATPPAAFEIRGGRTDGHHGHAVGGGSAVAGWSMPHGTVNQLLTIGLIPLALLVQAWGPLFGSTFVLPVRRRRVPFYLLLVLGLSIVVAARVVYQPTHTQVTPKGHLNWYSPQNPPVFVAWAYGLWALVIGAPFLLWWRPFWQSVLIVSWGWIWATMSYIYTDSAPVSGAFTCRSTPRLYSSTPRW